jgi:hypothetical protein
MVAYKRFDSLSSASTLSRFNFTDHYRVLTPCASVFTSIAYSLVTILIGQQTKNNNIATLTTARISTIIKSKCIFHPPFIAGNGATLEEMVTQVPNSY